MKNKQILVGGFCVVGVVVLALLLMRQKDQVAGIIQSEGSLNDLALLALIKNDSKSFEEFIKRGGDVHSSLPEIDGKVYTVSQGLSIFERPAFGELLHAHKVPYIKQEKKAIFDILSLAVGKNNLDLLKQFHKENPNYHVIYGKNNENLLHLASASCSHKVIEFLHKEGKLSWEMRTKKGASALTIAAESECLPILSYWKENNANFRAKDGRGLTALGILKIKKDAALMAFAQSFENRNVASGPSFYKKRKIPKDQVVDHSALIEPGDRPLDATETSEYSEFSD